MFTIRPFEPLDFDAVVDLHHLGLAQTGADGGPGPWDDDLASAQAITAAYEESGGVFIVGLRGNRVVAMGALLASPSGEGEVKRMSVHPDVQRRGYGQAILSRLEAIAVERGIHELRLDTTSLQGAAIGLYTKNGYVECGREIERGFEVIGFEKHLDAVAGDSEPSHWLKWHGDYEDPNSELSRRLAVVVSRTRGALDLAPPGAVRLVSACAGQGHDVVGALRDHPRRDDVRGRLVELDPRNVQACRSALASADLRQIEAVEGDAGSTESYVGAVPAHIVLLCGIFGNVSADDIENTIRHAPQFCAPGATVIWTRHRRTPDLVPAIRDWFQGSGFEEITFDSVADDSFGVGVVRLIAEPEPLAPGVHLFAFI